MFGGQVKRTFSAVDTQNPRSSKTVIVRGRITEVIIPKIDEEFDPNWSKVKIDGHNVVGAMPHLDRHCIFNLECQYIVNKRGEQEYKITGYGSPPFVPDVLSFSLLATLLREINGLSTVHAETLCHHLKLLPALKNFDPSYIDPVELMTALDPMPPELLYLSQRSIIFRWPFMQKLADFWSVADLKRLKLNDLIRLSVKFSSNEVENFAYQWNVDEFNLPEISFPKIMRWFDAQLKERRLTMSQLRNLSPEEAKQNTGELDLGIYARTSCYNNAKKWLEHHPQTVIPVSALEATGSRFQPCVQWNIMKVYGLRTGPRNEFEPHLMIYPLLDNFQKLSQCFRRLLSKNPARILPKKRRPKGFENLNPGQLTAYSSFQTHNLLLLTGDAGTGKSFVMCMLSRSFKKNQQEAVAYYGRVAALLRKDLGKGSTIHKLIARIENSDPEEAQKIRAETKVLFVDEGSVISLELLVKLLSHLDVDKLLIAGDPEQMRPPVRGPIFEELLEYAKNTAFTVHLTQIMRVKDNVPGKQILLDNFLKIKDGNPAVNFTQKLNEIGECPWLYLPREDVPIEQFKGKNFREHRISAWMNTMRPLVTHFDGPDEFQVLTQKNEAAKELSIAMARLWTLKQHSGKNGPLPDLKGIKAGEKICFTENYTSKAPELPTPNGQNAQKIQEIQDSLAYRLRTDSVNRNEVDVILQIVDWHPYRQDETHVTFINEEKKCPEMVRIVRLLSGRQINIAEYPLSKILRGDVSTVASSQGSEFKISIIVVSKPLSPYFTRKQAYTGSTRGKEAVIWVMGRFSSIFRSEFAQILAQRDEDINFVLNKFLEPIDQIQIAEDELKEFDNEAEESDVEAEILSDDDFEDA